MPEMELELLHQGIAACKSGELDLARNYLERVCWLQPTQDQLLTAMFYLSELEEDPARKRRLLENILLIDPLHPEARRSVAVLEGRWTPESAAGESPDAAPAEEPRAEARIYICRSCGGRMRFSPEGDYLHCDYCHSRATLAQELERRRADHTEDFMVALARSRGHRAPILARSATCPGCGAGFALPHAALSLRCPYCAAAIVLETASMREWIPPHVIIPFTQSRGQALSALQSWLSDRWARENIHLISLENIYLPTWSFDIAGEMSSVSSDGTGKQAAWPVHYTSVLVPATHSLPMTLAGLVSSFRMADAQPFTPAMLADWPAEIYQIAPAEASLAAREQVLKAETKTASKSARGFLSMAGVFVDTFQQFLLPVWFARFQTSRMELRAAVNGQSGLVFGELRRQTGLLSRILGGG
jgi:DNA-directed RNA polymerase subunit RPC12/RpoP